MPVFVSVEPADFCNLHCPECPVGNATLRTSTHSSNQCMPMQLFESVLQQVQLYAYTMQFYFQGEPLLNTQLPQMIRMASRMGLYTIVSTNAQLLTPLLANQLIAAGLNRIIVSIDGFTEQSYTAYRQGGHLSRALEGLSSLRTAKQQQHASTIIELQVLRLKTNENEWTWIRHRYRYLGADRLVFKTAMLYHYEHGHPLMPSNPRYSRYRKGKDGLFHLHRLSHRSCYRLWSGCVITASGEMLPCCYDKDSHYSFGNILTASIQTLWTNDKANHFRQMVLHHRASIPICQECNY